MKEDNNSKATGTREAELTGGLSKAALIAGLVASWSIAGEAIVPSDVAAQEQPPLAPVTVESPTPRPRAATQPAARASSTRVKRAARRTNRTATRPNPTPAPVTATIAPPPPAVPKEGSEAAGYKPETASNFGPLGRTPILDVPYSVNVISSDLIENRLGSSTEAALQISPVVQLTYPNNRLLNPSFNLRGFNFQGNTSPLAIDGIRGNMGVPIPIEDKERVEIYTGLTNFLYGPTDVGGLVNYVYKRPTETPLANITIGDYGNLAGFVHGDFSGPIDKEGMFAYRLNLVEQHGGLPVSPQSEDRQLATLALDWHILPGTTLEVIGSHQYAALHTVGAYWGVGTNANGASLFNYSWVPNPSKIYGEPWTTDPIETDRAEINLTSKLNDIFTARAAYAFNNTYEFPELLANNTLSDNSGSYTQGLFRNNAVRIQTQSGYGFLDAQFNTWSIEHKMTMGYYGNYYQNQAGAGSASPYVTVASGAFSIFTDPVYVTQPNLMNPISYNGARYTSSIAQTNNYVIGDQIKFNGISLSISRRQLCRDNRQEF